MTFCSSAKDNLMLARGFAALEPNSRNKGENSTSQIIADR